MSNQEKIDQLPLMPMQKRPERLDGLVFLHFTEDTNSELAIRARRVHASGYESMGFVSNSAIDIDGSLSDDIDHARGETVEYYLGVEPAEDDMTETFDRATLRKISIPSGGSLDDLPAYSLCKNSIYNHELAALQSIEQPDKFVKEIGALARSPEAGPMATFEVLRDALHDSLGNGELWFFSIVTSTYASLADNFGKKAIRQIGEPVALNDPRVSDRVELVPAVVDIDSFLKNILEAAELESSRSKQHRLLRSFSFFSEGLTNSELTDELIAAREVINSQSSSGKS